jgi:hypothetical protein
LEADHLLCSVFGVSGRRHRIVFGWHAIPIFEHTGAVLLSASRVQVTHSSVQRLQFGWSTYMESSLDLHGGGTSSSAASAPLMLAQTVMATIINLKRRIRTSTIQFAPITNKNGRGEPGHFSMCNWSASKPMRYFQSTLAIS